MSGNCYRYRFSIADNVGNRSTTVTAAVDAKVDTLRRLPPPRPSRPPAGTYNTAGWNAGCGTERPLRHPDSDAPGSGHIQGVELSIRQGVGNYWNGSGFASVHPRKSGTRPALGGRQLVADPSPSANFPADGSYTVRVRATDAAGTSRTPSTRNVHDRPRRSADDDRLQPGEPHRLDEREPSRSARTRVAPSFECRIDGGAWGACTTPRNYTSLTDGSHTFRRARHRRRRETRTPPRPPTPGWSTGPHRPPQPTFPVASCHEYNATGWAAGCGTAGLCGTYSDGCRLRRLPPTGLHPPGHG